jgi:hypothetical protein
MSTAITLPRFPSSEKKVTPTWRVTPVQQSNETKPRLSRVFARKEPTAFQRCLAVHMYFAGPRGGLS